MDYITRHKSLSTENRLIDALILACQKDNLKLFIQLSKICNNIDFNEFLKITCMHNSLKIAKWIVKNKTINSIKEIFIELFMFDNLTLIKLLYEYCNINLSESDWEELFFNACNNNQLELIKWILQIRPDIDISMHNNNIFDTSCCNNYLDLAQFLLQHKPDIICMNMDYIYAYAKKDNLNEMMKWLIQINPLIDIFYEIYEDRYLEFE